MNECSNHLCNTTLGDLKPENVLVTAKGHLKLTDFGTASLEDADDEEMRNSFVGTAEYVSPEVGRDA